MDSTDAICPVPRILGWYDVAVRVTFTSDDGVRIRIAHGTYLDSHEQEGPIFLGDGIELMLHQLGLDLPKGDALHRFCHTVTRALVDATTATLPFHGGNLLFELTPWQEVPGSLMNS